MNSLKKIITSIFSVSLCMLFVIFPVYASSNSNAVLSALRSGVNVDGKNIVMPASYINQAENYFASHQITDAQTRYILAEINGAKAAIKEAGVTNLKNMDKATKQKVLAAAQSAANDIDLKMSIGSDKHVQIVDPKGSAVFNDNNVIKTTGPSINYSDWAFAWSAVFLLAIGGCFFFIKKYNLMEHGVYEP